MDERNKRIASNTIVIYIRMFVSMIVSLYTSRIVLQVLGVSDYGVYTLVGGVTIMFSFLNNVLGGSTSRFINYAMGLKDVRYFNNTFRTALLSHLIIAASVFFLCETMGVWMLVNKLVIPEERLFAAHVILQLSILSMCIGIIQGPFHACIIAHEHFSLYAYVEILVVILKLIIVYVLLVVNMDKLILYSLLLCLISLLSLFIYVSYSKRRFCEISFIPLYKREFLFPMLSFSGWRLVACLSGTFSDQGRIMLLNVFFGTIVNAAAGLANTVQSVISGFAYNVLAPFRPQIVTCYAEKNYSRMQLLIEEAFAISNLLFLFVGIPIFVECDYVLNLWLVDVPKYTVPFVRIILMASFLANNFGFECTIIGATGHIKYSQLCISVFSVLSIIISYLFLLYGLTPEWVFYPYVFINILIFIIHFFLMKRNIPELNLNKLLMRGFSPVLIIFLSCFAIIWVICLFLNSGFLRLLIIILFNTLFFCVGCYFLVLSDSLKKELLLKLKNFV